MRAPDGWWAPPKKANLGEQLFPFRRLALAAAGNASRWALRSGKLKKCKVTDENDSTHLRS